MSQEWHVKVVAGRLTLDPYADPDSISKFGPCKCRVVKCGGVIADEDCEFHGKRTTMKIYAHLERECPGKEVPDVGPKQLRLW